MLGTPSPISFTIRVEEKWRVTLLLVYTTANIRAVLIPDQAGQELDHKVDSVSFSWLVTLIARNKLLTAPKHPSVCM